MKIRNKLFKYESVLHFVVLPSINLSWFQALSLSLSLSLSVCVCNKDRFLVFFAGTGFYFNVLVIL